MVAKSNVIKERGLRILKLGEQATFQNPRRIGAIGSASVSKAEGREFKSLILHIFFTNATFFFQKKNELVTT